MYRIILLILIVTSCGLSKQTTSKDVIVNNDKLKNYAFCTCLNFQYPKDSSLVKDGSSSAYLENSNYGINIFEGIDSITRIYSDSINLKSKYNRNLGLMKCLDYYNSPYLDSSIMLLLNKKR